MIAIHVVSMIAITIGALVKGFLLLFDYKETFSKFEAATSKPNKILTITGVLAGIYLVIFRFGGVVPLWLIIKLAFLVAGGTLVALGQKKDKKLMLVAGMIFLILVVVQANVKLS